MVWTQVSSSGTFRPEKQPLNGITRCRGAHSCPSFWRQSHSKLLAHFSLIRDGYTWGLAFSCPIPVPTPFPLFSFTVQLLSIFFLMHISKFILTPFLVSLFFFLVCFLQILLKIYLGGEIFYLFMNKNNLNHSWEILLIHWKYSYLSLAKWHLVSSLHSK